MAHPVVGPVPLRLFQYSVASGDMYFAELGERAILLGRDKLGHIRIWGENESARPSTTIGLCQVFLEYALYCSSWCTDPEARDRMEDFGERLGQRLALYLQMNPDLIAPDDPTVRALEQIFGAIGADFTEDHLQAGVRFLVSHCPIQEAARRLGLPHAELARHGINAMCRRLIHEMNPGVLVVTALDNQPELMFTLTSAIPV